VQMQGAKRWRVFTPPTDGHVKPLADPFSRGKGEDSMPLHTLSEGKDSRLGSELLIDVVTREGDILFMPAGFPHTTDTVEETDADYHASIHLTFNIDTHVWNLDNLNVRNTAIKRSGLKDILAPQSVPNEEVNLYTGRVNQLPNDLRCQLMDALPLDFLDMNPIDFENISVQIANMNEATGDSTSLSSASIKEALERIQGYGTSILDIYRDIYLAAVDEGRLRDSEAKITAHVSPNKKSLNAQQMQRLSLFRVRPFFEQIEATKKELHQWCLEGSLAATSVSSSADSVQIDPNWPLTSPLKVGDEVEADLGGAYFEARVSKVAGNTFNVVFFDGDKADGLERNQIKLLNPPATDTEDEDDFDTTGLTKKEIKKMRKKLEKKRRK